MKDVGQRTNLVGPTRRVTTGDDHSHARVIAHDATHRLTDTLIRSRSYRARVHHDELGILWRCFDGAAQVKVASDRKRIGLIDPAAERDDRVLEGVGSHLTRTFAAP